MTAFIKTYADEAASLQQPFDVSVVIPTIMRSEIADAIRSVFSQDFTGRIQILIGIDKPIGDLSVIDEICRARPSNCVLQVIYLGYSTSVRHGGLSPARDGGVLRCILSYCANSPYVAYLDDDNWWRPDHLRLLRQAVDQADWAFSLRWFVHPATRHAVCVDQWESVGPGAGIFQAKFGGFVDPNCLMINKIRCEGVLNRWNVPLDRDEKGMSADRSVFAVLSRHFKGVGTGQPTVFYKLDPQDGLQPYRMQLFGPLYQSAEMP